MIQSFLTLLAFQLVGECMYRAFSLPLPGPVIGMALLTLWLLWRKPAANNPLQVTARHLLQILGLLFVPAGVGIVASLDLVRAQWLPITVAVLASTLLSLIVTAYVMKWLCARQSPGEQGQA